MDYGFLGWVVVGFVVGVFAKWIMLGKDPGGIIVTILIGIAGGLLGGYFGSMLGFGGGNSNIINILIATAGAILLLWIYRMIKARQA
jgi:uncharacterized membrane protein YeaQ/YmgE (transglycosylase-associated protein family)